MRPLADEAKAEVAAEGEAVAVKEEAGATVKEEAAAPEEAVVVVGPKRRSRRRGCMAPGSCTRTPGGGLVTGLLCY
jgi:hypothetical protein